MSNNFEVAQKFFMSPLHHNIKQILGVLVILTEQLDLCITI